MLVAFDSSFLIPLFDSRYGEAGALDPRLAHLIATLEREKATIVIPAPALSEVLIGAGDAAPRYLNAINISARFRVAPFAERAAVEAAAAHREAIKAGDKREGQRFWQKVKYDRQIIAIATVEGASILYSNDDDIRRLAVDSSIEVVRLDELPLSPPTLPAPQPQERGYIPNLFDAFPPEDPPVED